MKEDPEIEHFKAILDSVSDPVLVIGPDYRVRFMNQAALNAASLPLKTDDAPLCYQTMQNFESHCEEYGEECPVKKVLATGEKAEITRKRFTEQQGESIYRISASPLFDETGKVVQVVEVLRNISDTMHLQNQQELIKQHKELGRVFTLVETAKKEWEMTMDCITDLVILADQDEKIKRFNWPFKQLMGIDHRDILAKEWKWFLLENGMRESGFFEDMPEMFHQESEKYFTVNVHVAKNQKRKTTGSVITLHDITTRKKFIQELEDKTRQIDENRQKLETALEQVSTLIQEVATKKDTNIRFINPGLKKCWEKMNCQKVDCPCYEKEGARCWEIAGTHCRGEVQGQFAQKLGSCLKCPYYQQSTADPTYQISEQFNHMMQILAAKNDELGNAYRTLKNTHSQMLQQDKMASIGQLAAGVAHEINNPVGFIASNLTSLGKYTDKLTTFISFLTEIDNDATNDLIKTKRKELKIDLIVDDLHDLISESLEGVERVKAIVQNLKSFSRVDQAEQKPSDLNECLESTINIVWNELKYKCTVEKEYGKIPLTRCYPQQLNQVFMNLLVNAAQAIEIKGTITIKTWHDENSIFTTIADTGKGIDPKDLTKIFEPFFTTKDVGKGTGLGLSIAYDIITKTHKGELFVTSEVGKGSTFMVKLPIEA
ncbi:MAG: PAS domain-containing protein [Proteobacteria bacterium]|nr:PAS domain-containing protein [Pseudomonadota bacterium]MBU1715362.1 PAS domain-containing protein [Pseudomonadota bacterium]